MLLVANLMLYRVVIVMLALRVTILMVLSALNVLASVLAA